MGHSLYGDPTETEIDFAWFANNGSMYSYMYPVCISSFSIDKKTGMEKLCSLPIGQ